MSTVYAHAVRNGLSSLREGSANKATTSRRCMLHTVKSRRAPGLVMMVTRDHVEKWPWQADLDGEWIGYEMEFDSTGAPVSLPYNVIPDVYREWKIDVYDWQHQCSMQMRDNVLYTQRLRMLPSPGCEADAAVVHTKEVERVDSALVVGLDGGSYTHGPPQLPNGQSEEEKTLVVETTFGHMGTCGQRKRMRVRSTLSQNARFEWAVKGMSVAHEVWDEGFNGGTSLVGCGGMPMEAVSSCPPVDIN
eukprot:CAMPEP_0198199978 /NCGR_PEP_ID=MMETSP1445-20131203/3064_1 /TAXON_ID=36898 /ORGANISM="Pyramimonas sp., Strain CCMP2087" /LENGTH=246 /DNA_ID=CAMNT_0043869895 /DNA_START=133 /DNA_END=870 /DNA_ORIENTATION=-